MTEYSKKTGIRQPGIGARGWTPASRPESLPSGNSPRGAAVRQTLQGVLNQAPTARAAVQLQRALNRGLRVAQLIGLSATLQGTAHAPIQLMPAGRDRERLRAARQNRVRFLAILMVVAANIANGSYALEDVDDLVQGPDHDVLVDEVRRRQELRAERRAQGQQQRNQQRNERRGQRHQRGGYQHR